MARTLYAENLALLRFVTSAYAPVREPSEGDASILVDRWYLGTDATLDPCGRFHHPLSPNGLSPRCERFWESLTQAAERLDVVIERGPDPCDVFVERYVEDEPQPVQHPSRQPIPASTDAEIDHLYAQIEQMYDEDEEGDDEPLTCGVCGGPLVALGALGRVAHFRCRNCGLDSSFDDAALAAQLDAENDDPSEEPY